MKIKIIICILITAFLAQVSFALEPNEILIIANSDIEASVKLAEFYCKARNVTKKNILALPLGKIITDQISRDNYNKKLAEPVRKKLRQPEFFHIRCLLTTYGVPSKVGKRAPQKDSQAELIQLKKDLDNQQKLLKNQDANSPAKDAVEKQFAIIKSDIDRIEGNETDASVDSELSMVLVGDYDLYRWQNNELKYVLMQKSTLIMMVSRLDGPSPQIAQGLVEKALRAEKDGLKGTAYIDSGRDQSSMKVPIVEQFDKSLGKLAELIKEKTDIPVVEETTPKLFEPNACPSAAIYCGWYRLQKYVDSFTFTDGAIAIHIASLEAVNLRDENSTQWCPSFLVHGAAATIGAVAEPYLIAFPDPYIFYGQLISGKCIVEAYYRANPFNSWRILLIADPLYTPFIPRFPR